MNKLLLSLIGISISSSAIAVRAPFTEVYAGANIGHAQSVAKDQYSTNVFVPGELNITYQSSPDKTTDDSLVGGLAVGFSHVFQQVFLLGVEGRVNVQHLHPIFLDQITEPVSTLLASTNTSIELNHDFALLARLGFILNSQFLIYGLVGPDWGHFKIASATSFTQSRDGFGPSGAIEGDSSGYKCGILGGFGLEYLFTKCTSIGIEYDYTDFQKLSFPSSISTTLTGAEVSPGSSLTDSNRISMKVNKTVLKFHYYF